MDRLLFDLSFIVWAWPVHSLVTGHDDGGRPLISASFTLAVLHRLHLSFADGSSLIAADQNP